jgi:PD-(D/E)XK nuclease superfamily protein
VADDVIELAEKPTNEPPDTGQPKGRVDDRNRYKIPHPETGRPARWTRATTFAKAIAETEALERWGKRFVAKGLAERPDLLVRVERTPVDQRRVLDAIAREAMTAAGAWKKAGYGTTFHSLTEKVDLGELDPFAAGPPWGAMLRAYSKILQDNRIKILPEYVERTVVVMKYMVAGTFDRVVEMPNGELWVADLKTGRDLGYSWGEIAIQLALYANADSIYDFDAGVHRPMPEVSKSQALIIHAPVEENFVALHRLNIEMGWQAAELCHAVRNWRKFRGLAEEVAQIPVGDDGPGLPRRWVARIEAATTISDLSLIWEEATRAGEWTEELEDLGHQRGAEINAG